MSGRRAPTRAPKPKRPSRARPAAAEAPAVAVKQRGARGRSPRAPGARRANIWAALRRVPVAAWVCALVACLNAVCWSIIMPPFQVPDEQDHFAYVQELAESGHIPIPQREAVYSPEETFALQDLEYYNLRRYPQSHAISSIKQQQRLQSDLSKPLPRRGNGGAGVATSQPPLYYALQTIPYAFESGGTILARLQLMRLLSTVLAGLTALFVFLFVREALPGAPWAWTVGGLGVALAPLPAVISGGVYPDALLDAISAARFYCRARGFHRGWTPRLGAAIGALIILGLLTKLNFIGLTPGIVLGAIVLTIRQARVSRRIALRSFALAVGVPAVPVFLYVAFKTLSGNPTVSLASSAINSTLHGPDKMRELGYIWQLYLPRLPGMANDFIGLFPSRQIWFNGLVGLYGWFDTSFPSWVYGAAILPASIIAALVIRALVVCRAALRRRLAELVVYLSITFGLMLLIGAASYVYFSTKNSGGSPEARYLMPLLALWGAVLALAARGAGRRWEPAAGVLIVVLFLAHDIFSQLLVISRYYG